MFSVTRSPLYDFNSLFHTLDSLSQYQQAQQLLQQQAEASRPKIVKKVETEDKYQIQIFKKQGNFNSYEVKVLRNAAYGNSSLINLVIESRQDEFRKVFQFNLNDIEVSQIDWEYFEADNVLVLNVPKKIKYCADDYVNSLLAGLFGLPNAAVVNEPRTACACHHSRERKHGHKRERRHRDREARVQAHEAARAEAERAEAARSMAARAEAARAEAERKAAEERARREAEERAKREADEKAKREAEAKAKREAEEKARRIAEEKARRIAEVRARKEAEAIARRRAEQEAQQAEQLRKQQEFVQAILGNVFPGFQFTPAVQTQQPKAASPAAKEASSSSPKETQRSPRASSEPPKPSSQTAAPTVDESDNEEAASEVETESETESILSDISTPDSRSSLKRSGDDLAGSAEKLHRHPSLEEVEDEEFVMFRKKFGEK